MNFNEVLAELPKLTPAERAEIIQRLLALDESSADRAAEQRARELATGAVQPKTQQEVFLNARAALK